MFLPEAELCHGLNTTFDEAAVKISQKVQIAARRTLVSLYTQEPAGQAAQTPDNMSKPISFGFGKPKNTTTGAPDPSSSVSTTPAKTSISLTKKPTTALSKPSGLKLRKTLVGDDSDPEEEQPKHEEVTGFSTSGAILSKPVEEPKELVIENAGNADWRDKGARRGVAGGKNLLPEEVQAARHGTGNLVMIEKNEVSKASGLQFATPVENGAKAEQIATTTTTTTTTTTRQPEAQDNSQPKTADEEALQALLSNDESRPTSNVVISAAEDSRFSQPPASEEESFRLDVASRPDPSSLADYTAMPVEEFGLAMLRGMGKKRRANGEVIKIEPLGAEKKDDKEKKVKRNEGYLGIGAKAVPGVEGLQLGAWGKADMRKNQRGEGFFTPVMVRDSRTGETITEEELERRKKGGGKGGEKERDWRERRDNNLEKSDRDGKNGDEEDGYSERRNGSPRRDRDDENRHDNPRSRRERDRGRDRDYDTESKRRRSRSRSRSRERSRRYRNNEDRYGSGSSRRDKERHRDKYKDRGYGRDERGHRNRGER